MSKYSLFYYQNERWQRLVHWLYFNGDEVIKEQGNTITYNVSLLKQCMQYTNNYLSNPKNDSLNLSALCIKQNSSLYQKQIIQLQSLNDKTSLNIEKKLSTFNSPYLSKILELWKKIFQAWKKIHTNKNHAHHEGIKEIIKSLLDNSLDKTISSQYLKLGIQSNSNPKFYIDLNTSLRNSGRIPIINLLSIIVQGKPFESQTYVRGNLEHLFATEKSLLFKDAYNYEITTKQKEEVIQVHKVPVLHNNVLFNWKEKHNKLLESIESQSEKINPILLKQIKEYIKVTSDFITPFLQLNVLPKRSKRTMRKIKAVKNYNKEVEEEVEE
ncbi:uncharacterized protein LOC131675506 isoform X1 [Phymastichus coffea]|uniref:uncharacterized protein LOC131675506 isoform X1 n=1 Tax=Phymastichus coffea TaxID=108790 RepID=UPI00273C7A8F|nr:uncharacterized protein LOC131675506 isoform X1 [Phymastichus coffea]